MFSNKLISRPLLTDTEIQQLIYAAPVFNQSSAVELSQAARMGEQIASVIGSGSDFAEVRAYNAGDDPRHIDWRATARSRVPLIRTYHSEFNQAVCLLIDRRAAMRYATRVRLKVTQALRMALWLGGRVARSGREISSVLLDYPSHWLPPQHGMHSLKLITKLANAPCPPLENDDYRADHKTQEWGRIFSGLQQHIPLGSELFLITDFWGLQDSDSKMLRMLGQHCTVTAIQIFDPSEVVPNFSTSLHLQWGNMTRYITSKQSEASLKLNSELQARRNTISNGLRQANISCCQLSVEQDNLSAVVPE